jgi:hypothetical protein
MYLPNKTTTWEFDKNWSSEAARQLISLGLLAGGSENNMRYNDPAQQKDLAFMLINGIYRIDRESYTPELIDRLRPFINSRNLTFDSLVGMIGALYGMDGEPDTVYKRLCDKNYINRVFRNRIEKLETNAETITMDMVYYIGAYSIRCYTGKDISGSIPDSLFITDEPDNEDEAVVPGEPVDSAESPAAS